MVTRRSRYMILVGQALQRLPGSIFASLVAVFLLSCAGTGQHPSSPHASVAEGEAMPEQAWSPEPAPVSSAISDASDITKIVVPSKKKKPKAIFRRSGPVLDVSIPDFEIPVTGSKKLGGNAVWAPGPNQIEKSGRSDPVPQSWVGTDIQFLSTDFDDNGTHNDGFRFIPPDPHAAAGLNHLVNVVNSTITFHQKNGMIDMQDSLANFFSALTPLTFTFDPKVIYDQYEDRWVVITMEQTAVLTGDLADTSRMFVAVSDDGDPNGTWYFSEFDTVVNVSGVDFWADYPGFAVDEEAVYITANLFSFFGGFFGGSRLWILDKEVDAGGFYDNGPLDLSELNPYDTTEIPNTCCVTTTQPSHMFGVAPDGVGVFLVSFSGISDGTSEYIQVLRLDDPLTAPAFNQQFVLMGNIDDLVVALPDMPQSGTATLIESNDRRALDAVWRDDALWLTTTINPNSGPDAGEATALWVKIDTDNLASLSTLDLGTIGGEDIATGTYTTFPSIAVNANEDVVVGFSASAPSIFAGAYFVNRQASDPAGFMGNAVTVQAGVAKYIRTFGGPRNRWGDYSATVVDPVDGCFWVYNEWADTEDTPIGGELGRWGTAYVKTCPTPVTCDATYDIDANEWTKFALPCSVAPDNSVAEIFGGSDPDDYDVTWGVFGRNSATQEYIFLEIGAPMIEGNGYWVISETATTVNLSGSPAAINDIDLVGLHPAGRDNYVGHNQNVFVDWNLVQVVDGASVLGIGDYDRQRGPNYDCDVPVHTHCVMSRIMHKWNGNVYEVFDGDAMTGTAGTLEPFDAIWVQAFKPGIKLRIPVGTTAAAASVAPGPSSLDRRSSIEGHGNDKSKKKGEPWFIRIVATADGMEDPGNVFGQLETATDGNDHHDLEEPSPFGSRYLSILFTNPLFDETNWGYTTDFRKLTKNPEGVWTFVVKASAGTDEVTIHWEGGNYLFSNTWLMDEYSGETMKVQAGGSYTFNIEDGEHHFSFELGGG